jgi:hypothetical protein
LTMSLCRFQSHTQSATSSNIHSPLAAPYRAVDGAIENGCRHQRQLDTIRLSAGFSGLFLVLRLMTHHRLQP